MVAVLNSEFAKCAAGDGAFVWGGNCNVTVADTALVTHFALAGGMPLGNPYKTDEASVSKDRSSAEGAQNLTAAAEEVDIAGRIAVFCAAGLGACTIKTDTGSGADLVNVIPRY